MFQTPNLVDIYRLWSAITGDTGAPLNSLILVIETTEERQLPTERNHLQLHKRSFRQVLNMGPLMPLVNLHYHPNWKKKRTFRMTMKLGNISDLTNLKAQKGANVWSVSSRQQTTKVTSWNFCDCSWCLMLRPRWPLRSERPTPAIFACFSSTEWKTQVKT